MLNQFSENKHCYLEREAMFIKIILFEINRANGGLSLRAGNLKIVDPVVL